MGHYQGDLFAAPEAAPTPTVIPVPASAAPEALAEVEWDEPLPVDEDEEDFVFGSFEDPAPAAVDLGPVDENGIPLSLLEGLNAPQRRAVETLSGPLMVVAGPGSGKTRVLTHRIAALLATGVKPWQVLAVTFTNKAASEMRERIGRLVGPEAASEMWVATFHSACVRILRSNHEAAGLPRSFSICDTSDVQRILRGVLTEANAPAEASAVKELAGAISWAKNAGRTAADLAASARMLDRATAPFMEAYNRRLQEMGAVDFDDILLRTLHLLESHPEVAERYQRKFHHVLVDEYQDTNVVQLRITQILASGHGNLCIVGDFDQAVYSWRGASPQAMSDFSTYYPEGRVVVLEQNYRSTKAILEVVQAIIDPNPAIHRPRLYTENVTGEAVRLYVAEDDKDEAAWVASQIRRTRDPLDAHAVLVRTNAQTRVFEEEFARNGTSYQVVGALRFYDRAEIKDALSYLRLAVNPRDEVNLARCINTPRRGIGDATVAALVKLARDAGVDAVTALRTGLQAGGVLPNRATASLRAFLAIYDSVVAACQVSPAEALRVVADEAGLREALKADKVSGLDRVENLDELVTSAEAFVDGSSPTRPEVKKVSDLPGWEQTEAFLENISLVSSADVGDDEDVPVARVSILTAHSSKGKEFPHVFVVGIEDTLYPHERSKGDPAAEEEERRLLFVAASRAERTLSLSHCKSRYMFNKAKENPPSPFLDDLPSSVVRIRSNRPGRPSLGGFGSGGFARPAQDRSHGRAGGFGRGTSGASTSSGSVGPARSTGLGAGKAKPAPGPRLAPGDAVPGAHVEHSVFGSGTVERLEGTKATVVFDVGTKTLDLAFAPLKLVEG